MRCIVARRTSCILTTLVKHASLVKQQLDLYHNEKEKRLECLLNKSFLSNRSEEISTLFSQNF